MMLAKPTAEYLVTHGKSGALGRFASTIGLRRGQRIVVETYRGVELGKVLCEATERHRQALPHSPGRVIREATVDDELQTTVREKAGARILSIAERSAREFEVEVLDAEVMLDGKRVILHYLGKPESDIEPLLQSLSGKFELEVFAENLAAPPPKEEEHGCGKPDCGKTAGGSCSSCESGGCSSCGHGGVDMTAYFAHLRGHMEANGRVPLV